MKKVFVIILTLSILFTSCSSNNCIKSYFKERQINIKEKNVLSVLTDKKIDVSNTINIYFGRKRRDWSTQAKVFSMQDYDFLRKQYKNDTLIEYWSKKESKEFEFVSLVKKGDLSKFRDSISLTNQNLTVYNYNLSKPIFTENKKLAFFSILVTKQPSTTVENCVIIMKKVSGKWTFGEKVNSTALH